MDALPKKKEAAYRLWVHSSCHAQSDPFGRFTFPVEGIGPDLQVWSAREYFDSIRSTEEVLLSAADEWKALVPSERPGFLEAFGVTYRISARPEFGTEELSLLRKYFPHEEFPIVTERWFGIDGWLRCEDPREKTQADLEEVMADCKNPATNLEVTVQEEGTVARRYHYEQHGAVDLDALKKDLKQLLMVISKMSKQGVRRPKIGGKK